MLRIDIKHKLLAIIIFVATYSLAYGQGEDTKNKVQPAQITLATPLGTNGANASKTINYFSLNALYGTSAGVRGAEFGGLFNITLGDVNGGQFSGLGNIVSGAVTGGQFAGVVNTSSAALNGAQVAGVINIAAGENAEFQSSNVAQFAGVLNVHSAAMTGVQVAGVANLHSSSIRGMQAAGILNTAKAVEGVQLSGLVNKAQRVNGVQIGLINIADTLYGTPIGLVNISKNGYRAIEVETNESFHANVSYKMGVSRLYSIISFGYRAQNGQSFWAPGFGIGSYMPMSERAGLNIDLINYHVNEGEWWTNELNQLNKLKINGSFSLAPRLAIYGGATLNVFVTKTRDSEGNAWSSAMKTKGSFYDEVHRDTRVVIFPGFNAGLRF